MQIKVKAFPAVYVSTLCTQHMCSVEINLEESKKFNTTAVLGSQITTLRCLEGGMPGGMIDCSQYWELQILASGEVTVGQ